MSFCEHCQGQRFDRARSLRALRRLRQELRGTSPDEGVDKAICQAIDAVKALDVPHLEPVEPIEPDTVVVH